ncbi:MAG TPA: F390 synthetase-related protein [Burkholderiaceae bacterium]
MSLLDLLRLCAALIRTRWGLRFGDRAAFLRWQRRKVQRFLNLQLARSAYYRPYAGRNLEQLPIMDKAAMRTHFDSINTAGISLEQATKVALQAERTRDFSPVCAGLTVGLSSGTSGSRGVFLVSPAERARWAGILLARTLSPRMLMALCFARQPLRVAFFLRANSNLYTTLASRRIDFRFHDLQQGLDDHLAPLAAFDPDVLVAPASILNRLAELALDGALALRPRRVIAVAEVLEPDDNARISQAFGGPVHQLYQCTEGFLGYTCAAGVMHLNEEFVAVEPEWLDQARTRFHPVITDFSRTTQLFIRHRLDDVLRVRATPCGCGAPGLALAGIEGRADDVLWLTHDADDSLRPLFPDMLRQAISAAERALPDYRIEQHGAVWNVAVHDEADASWQALTGALDGLLRRHALHLPEFRRVPFRADEAGAKRRRIRCIQRAQAVVVPSQHASSLASGRCHV